MTHEVVVGNVGTVYSGEDAAVASVKYADYRELSEANLGRAAGESVTWLQDGEVYREYVGTVDREDEDA